jgi:hypothetical protein
MRHCECVVLVQDIFYINFGAWHRKNNADWANFVPALESLGKDYQVGRGCGWGWVGVGWRGVFVSCTICVCWGWDVFVPCTICVCWAGEGGVNADWADFNWSSWAWSPAGLNRWHIKAGPGVRQRPIKFVMSRS